MRGQWFGYYSGYSTGMVTLEIDEREANYSGRACVFENGNNYFVYVFEFETPDKKPLQQLSLPVKFQRFGDVTNISRDELDKVIPNVSFPNFAKIELKFTKKGIRAKVEAFEGLRNLGTLNANLTSGSAERRSKLLADKKVRTWEKFKIMVGSLPPDRFIFRGQPVTNRLRTSFHRTNRRDLHRFQVSDIPLMHGMVTSKTKHYFDLRDNIQNAAFWNLLQHHGYPTPLLDWTHSPYVAAYFGFREKSRPEDEANRKIRIFMLDRAEWVKDYDQLNAVVNVKPHFSILAPIALENPRALPQQAICSITTVDDVEEYLALCGQKSNKVYLRVFELPYAERATILAELRLMGVAAGALFPGMDGACEEMRLKNFDV